MIVGYDDVSYCSVKLSYHFNSNVWLIVIVSHDIYLSHVLRIVNLKKQIMIEIMLKSEVA